VYVSINVLRLRRIASNKRQTLKVVLMFVLRFISVILDFILISLMCFFVYFLNAGLPVRDIICICYDILVPVYSVSFIVRQRILGLFGHVA